MSIPFHRPFFDEEEVEAVTRALKRNLIGTGPVVASFEREFRQHMSIEHAIAVNSCTSALHLALDSFGIGAGDEVITTPLTFCATILAIHYVGATPVLADIDPATMCMDPVSVSSKVSSRTKAILPVHFAGHPCDMEALRAICLEHKLILIEDAAHAFTTKYKGKWIGESIDGIRSAACFSFHATKSLSIGDGGMITTSDPEAAEIMVSKRLFGMSRLAELETRADVTLQYTVNMLGYKYNMTDLEAAIGRVQLAKAGKMQSLRIAAAESYLAQLERIPGISLPHRPEDGQHAWHLFVIRVQKELRSGLIRYLLDRGIKTTIHFTPVYRFPFFQSMFPDASEQLPHMESLADELLSLPMFPGLTMDEISIVASAVRAYMSEEARCMAY